MSRGFINLLGPLFVRVFRPGASEVKTLRVSSATDSSTRATVLTPTSGKRVRIISISIGTLTATNFIGRLYFGTGAAISTTPANALFEANIDNSPAPGYYVKDWPDGGGPIGDVDEVVSMITDVDIGGGMPTIITYREE